MKKILAMVLAIVMTMSLVATMSVAGAYSDDKTITHTEAVGVLSELKIIDGYEDKSFKPTGEVTRAEMAAIVCRALLGRSTADKLTSTKAPFDDVAAGSWAAGYISYCVNLGIIAGYGDGNFGPNDKVTGSQAAKMLLIAAKYKDSDGKTPSYTGKGWEATVATAADDGDFLNDLDDVVLSAPLTRDSVAQMTLNALKYTSSEDMYRVSVTTTVDDKTTTKYYDFEDKSDAAMFAGLKDGATYVGKVKANYDDAMITDVHDVDVDDGVDAFGRTATTYSNKDWDSNLIYADAPDYTFVVTANDTTLEDVVEDNSLTRKITSYGNYDAVKAAKALQVGDVVELYVDDNKELSNVVTYYYQTAQIDDVSTVSSKDAKNNGAAYQITLKSVTDATDDDLAIDNTIYDINLPEFDKATYVEDAVFTYPVKFTWDAEAKVTATAVVDDLTNGKGDYDILYPDFTVAGTSTGKVTGVDSSNKVDYVSEYVKVDGTKVSVATLAASAKLNNSYVFYLDPNGIAVNMDKKDTATLDDVLYVAAVYEDTDTSYGETIKTVYAQTVNLTGKVTDYAIGKFKGDAPYSDDTKGMTKEQALTYINGGKGLITVEKGTKSKDTKNLYEMTNWPETGDDDYEVGAIKAGYDFDKDDTKVSSSDNKGQAYRLNSSTTYIAVEDSLSNIDVTTVKGGINFTLDSDKAGIVISEETNSNEVALYVIIPTGNYNGTSTSSKDVVYVDNGADCETTTVNGDDGYIKFNVYGADGKTMEVVYEDTKMPESGFYTYSTNKDGVTDLDNDQLDDLTKTLKADYDDEEGYFVAKYASQYGTTLTTNSTYLNDIETKNAAIVDIHDTDDKEQYTDDITTLSSMQTAAKSADIELAVYCNNGAVLIVVTDATLTSKT